MGGLDRFPLVRMVSRRFGRRSVGSQDRAETAKIVDKSCQVSEAFGSRSDKSLRTPLIHTRRLRSLARVRGRACVLDFTSSNRRPTQPRTSPTASPAAGLTTQTLYRSGNRQAKVRNHLSDSAMAMHGETHVLVVRTSPRYLERSWWVPQARAIPLLLADC